MITIRQWLTADQHEKFCRSWEKQRGNVVGLREYLDKTVWVRDDHLHFVWGATPEGFDYWEKIWHAYFKGWTNPEAKELSTIEEGIEVPMEGHIWQRENSPEKGQDKRGCSMKETASTESNPTAQKLRELWSEVSTTTPGLISEMHLSEIESCLFNAKEIVDMLQQERLKRFKSRMTEASNSYGLKQTGSVI